MLFSPYDNGEVRFANRIAMAPMTRCRARHADAVPNDLMVEYYRQRASAGLLISEGAPVSDRARGYINTPALWNEDQAAGWRQVTDAVHAAGGKIFAQLWHCGRISHSALHADRSKPAAPSVVIAKTQTFIFDPSGRPELTDCEAPEALSTSEIKAVVGDFAQAARLARQAGFDGVEIHGANGYLLDQFRCPHINKRSDAYGGVLANRYRLLLEVVDAVADEWGPKRVCVRQSPYGEGNDMRPDPEPMVTYPWLARELENRGIGFLHIYDQKTDWIGDPRNPLMQALRQAYGGGLMACGNMTKQRGEVLLASGAADLIVIGKPFISNPDLVTRLEHDIPLAPWDTNTFYTPGEKGYIDYPRAD